MAAGGDGASGELAPQVTLRVASVPRVDVFAELAVRTGCGIYDVIDELISPNYLSHGLPMSISGPQEYRQTIETFRSGFPDLYMLVEEQIAEGDQVSNQGYITGTHRGEFLGVAASGQQIKVNVISMWRFENNKVVENWVQIDFMGLMQQIGAVPP